MKSPKFKYEIGSPNLISKIKIRPNPICEIKLALIQA